jgi:hypothetical protein
MPKQQDIYADNFGQRSEKTSLGSLVTGKHEAISE